jgi:hypothetical protein
MTSSLNNPITDSAITLSEESPLLPTDGSIPASVGRSEHRMDRYCDPRRCDGNDVGSAALAPCQEALGSQCFEGVPDRYAADPHHFGQFSLRGNADRHRPLSLEYQLSQSAGQCVFRQGLRFHRGPLPVTRPAGPGRLRMRRSRAWQWLRRGRRSCQRHLNRRDTAGRKRHHHLPLLDGHILQRPCRHVVGLVECIMSGHLAVHDPS